MWLPAAISVILLISSSFCSRITCGLPLTSIAFLSLLQLIGWIFACTDYYLKSFIYFIQWHVYAGCFECDASYMETGTDTKSTVTIFDRTTSKLQNSVLQHSAPTLGMHMSKSLHDVLIKICIAIQNVTYLSSHCHHFWNVLFTVLLFDLRKFSASEYQCVPFFSAEKNSITDLCFICTSVSDVIF